MNPVRKTSLSLALTLTLLIGSAEPQADELATIYGSVKRPPASTAAPAPTVNRYRTPSVAPAAEGGTDCRCNPGLYSVVYLTGEHLPPLVLPDSLPTVAQTNQRFEPSVLAVCVGSRVSFPNLDPFYHNVFSYSSTKRFDLGRYARGETRIVEFDKPGIVKVFCEIHLSMRAYVHVLATPYFTTSDENGNFRLEGVQSGAYTLHVWQENLPEIERPLVVDADSLFVEVR